MKVFLSWAGEASKGIALALRESLPNMLQGLQPFMSKHDIDSGARWGETLSTELAQTNYGILCLTPRALRSEWLLFEAGAITKLRDGKACGLLHGLQVKDVAGPLAQFQHRPLDSENFLTLLQDLNKQMAQPLEAGNIAKIHGKWWPDLAGAIANIAADTAPQHQAARSQSDILEELVTRVRNMQRAIVADRPSSTGRFDWPMPIPDLEDSPQNRVDTLLALPLPVFKLVHELLRLRTTREVQRTILGTDLQVREVLNACSIIDKNGKVGSWVRSAFDEALKILALRDVPPED
jgi:hypothetical protein